MKFNNKLKTLLTTSVSFLFSLICISLHAQNQADIIAAEKGFAKYAADHNTRDAFVKYLSDSAIVFGSGSPAYGRPRWQARKPDSTLLSWYPSFAAIASSGEMGCTSGPWEFRSKKTDAEAAGFGHFATIWQKQANGQWLVMLDIGIQHEKQGGKEPEATADGTIPSKQAAPAQGLEAIENEFIAGENAKGITVFKDYIAGNAEICRPGQFPEISLQNIKTPPANSTLKYIYSMMKSAVSRSADFGYAYGKVSFTADSQMVNGNYLRVWKREKGKWKIILDVIAV
ncbi:hypothetical protein BH09BAC6_BH09BAC6_11520 [soil metagenome]|jgi:ketosteroid isomerase-like protein